MTRDEIIAQMTILIDRAYEAGFDNGDEAGYDRGYEIGFDRGRDSADV